MPAMPLGSTPTLPVHLCSISFKCCKYKTHTGVSIHLLLGQHKKKKTQRFIAGSVNLLQQPPFFYLQIAGVAKVLKHPQSIFEVLVVEKRLKAGIGKVL